MPIVKQGKIGYKFKTFNEIAPERSQEAIHAETFKNDSGLYRLFGYFCG
jgi:hypothetical protein